MLDIRPKTFEQTVALGRSVPSNSTGRRICDRRPLGKNLRPALEPDSGELPAGKKLQRLLEVLSPSFCRRPQPPAGWKVQWRVGPRRTVLRATAPKAGSVRPADTSGLPVRTDAPSDDEVARGVVQ